MKVNILNKLIVDPEDIVRVQITSEKVSAKEREYNITFLFKDNSHYYISFGTVRRNNTTAKKELLAEMENTIQQIYDQITKEQ